jgi:hypothetical protein
MSLSLWQALRRTPPRAAAAAGAVAAAALAGGGIGAATAAHCRQQQPEGGGNPFSMAPPPPPRSGGGRAAGRAWSWPDPRTFTYPAGERPTCMFDGHSFAGWEGKIGRYWQIEDGAIKAIMNPADAPPVSTYLISTSKHYRNFRLLFEMRMPVGNHSGVGFWGRRHTFEGEDFTWQGHLAILPQTGIFDIYRRGWKERVAREGGKTFGISGDWLCKGPGTGGEVRTHSVCATLASGCGSPVRPIIRRRTLHRGRRTFSRCEAGTKSSSSASAHACVSRSTACA